MGDPFEDNNPYDFNLPSGYKQQSLALGRDQAIAETNAMEDLQKAMRNSAEVTPTQGLAASLLAAVPTLGGYLIGKSVGTPDIPEGVYFNTFDEYKKVMGDTGGFAGGAAGAKLGQEAESSYLKGLDAEQAQKSDIYQKMAALESAKAGRAQTESSALVSSGLAKQAQEDLIPLQEASQIRINAAREAAQAKGGASPSLELRIREEDRRQRELDARLSGDLASKLPSSTLTKVGSADSASAAQERLRELYAKAIEEIGPGALRSVARSAEAKIPGTIQAEFLNTIKSVAMELNKAVDPSPSESGMQAQYGKLISTLESGNFLNALDFEVKNARKKALSELNVYASGSSPNKQAKSLVDEFSRKWKMPEQNSTEGVSPSMGGTTGKPKPPPINPGESKEDYIRRVSGG